MGLTRMKLAPSWKEENDCVLQGYRARENREEETMTVREEDTQRT